MHGGKLTCESLPTADPSWASYCCLPLPACLPEPAVVHHSAERARQDFKVAASLHPVLAAGACASRTERTQRELHLLRQAASDARNPLEEAVYQRVAWMKSSLRCDSATGGGRRGRVRAVSHGCCCGACACKMGAAKLQAGMASGALASLSRRCHHMKCMCMCT